MYQYKMLVKEFLDLSWNKGNFEAIKNLAAPNFYYQTTFTENILNIHKYIDFVSAFREAMPELVLEVEETMCEDTRLMTHVSFHGTVEKSFYGIPASDKIIAFPAVSLWEINNSKVQSLNTLIDIRGVERQLNVNLATNIVT